MGNKGADPLQLPNLLLGVGFQVMMQGVGSTWSPVSPGLKIWSWESWRQFKFSGESSSEQRDGKREKNNSGDLKKVPL